MSAEQGLIELILTRTDQFLVSFVSEGYAHFVQVIRPWIISLISLSVALFGWGLLIGYFRFPMRVFMAAVLKLSCVLLLANYWDVFNTLIVETVFRVPSELAASLISDVIHTQYFGVTQVEDALQIAFNKGMSLSLEVMREASIYHLSPLLYGAASSFIIFLLCGLILAYLVISKIALGVLLVVAPLFLLFKLYAFTSPMTTKWLSYVASFALTPLFVYAALTLVLYFLEFSLLPSAAQAPTTLKQIASLLMTGIIGLPLLMQLRQVAFGLGESLSLYMTAQGHNHARLEHR